MSKPIDSKTVSIYDHLKKRPSLDTKEIENLNPTEVYEVDTYSQRQHIKYY